MRKKIFFDTEFTGLHKNTTLISIGLVSDCGKTFYAELIDYDKNQIDKWLQDNVIANLTLGESHLVPDLNRFIEWSPNVNNSKYKIKSSKDRVSIALKQWLARFGKVEMWSDCLSYDWVLFLDLFGHAFDIPSNVYYIPFDICTLFYMKGIDPDISREAFAEMQEGSQKHNALWDAQVIKGCYLKMENL